ncbi:hypothetical protein CGLAMM_07330 [Acetobacteraceae bacterium EV16G]|uniref:Uncharacterized protein n=1 Tax=Sorlinia euscelidii TaxID=3081148 RepID=A0ABU7U2X7_9PROT
MPDNTQTSEPRRARTSKVVLKSILMTKSDLSLLSNFVNISSPSSTEFDNEIEAKPVIKPRRYLFTIVYGV